MEKQKVSEKLYSELLTSNLIYGIGILVAMALEKVIEMKKK